MSKGSITAIDLQKLLGLALDLVDQADFTNSMERLLDGVGRIILADAVTLYRMQSSTRQLFAMPILEMRRGTGERLRRTRLAGGSVSGYRLLSMSRVDRVLTEFGAPAEIRTQQNLQRLGDRRMIHSSQFSSSEPSSIAVVFERPAKKPEFGDREMIILDSVWRSFRVIPPAKGDYWVAHTG